MEEAGAVAVSVSVVRPVVGPVARATVAISNVMAVATAVAVAPTVLTVAAVARVVPAVADTVMPVASKPPRAYRAVAGTEEWAKSS